jgi:hypothetical protein
LESFENKVAGAGPDAIPACLPLRMIFLIFLATLGSEDLDFARKDLPGQAGFAASAANK